MNRRRRLSAFGFLALALATYFAWASDRSALDQNRAHAEIGWDSEASTTLLAWQDAHTLRGRKVSPDTLVLQGTLLLGEFYGPPNYGEAPETDRLERQYYLQLPAPILTQFPDATMPGNAEANRSSAYFLQLVMEDWDRLDPKAHLGEKVQVTGTLMEWWSGHHRTPLLLLVETLDPVDQWHW